MVESGRIAVEAGGVAAHVIKRRGGSRRKRAAVLADEIGGHPLAQSRQMDRVCQQHEVAVHVSVDEAGGHIMPRHVDHLRREGVVEPRDFSDHRVDHAYVAAKRWPAGSIDDPAALQEQVECHELLSDPFSKAGHRRINGA